MEIDLGGRHTAGCAWGLLLHVGGRRAVGIPRISLPSLGRCVGMDYRLFMSRSSCVFSGEAADVPRCKHGEKKNLINRFKILQSYFLFSDALRLSQTNS